MLQRFAHLVAIGALAAACTAAPTPATSCERDVDCPLHFYCRSTVCDRDCTLDVDCASGQTCSMRGRCVGVDPTDGGIVADAIVLCARNADCANSTYCDGMERCMPGAQGADTHGCLPASAPACPTGATCDEAARTCTGCNEDVDMDHVRSIRCGGLDCDDNDANRFPGNPETCSGDPTHDEDCDPTTFGFRDRDGDGATSRECCNVDDAGVSHCGPDCDDMNAMRTPGRIEACDMVDNDCDGIVDEDSIRTFYQDRDMDGYGSPDAMTMRGCTAPTGYVDNTIDCAPDDASRNPGVGETRCDGLDDNCNMMIDEGLAGVACVTGLPAPCGTGAIRCSSTGSSCVATTTPSCSAGSTLTCSTCGISGLRQCDGCQYASTCQLPGMFEVIHYGGTDPALHMGITCPGHASSSDWLYGPAPSACLFISGPAIPLPAGNYTATIEAIYGVGNTTRFDVINGTINPSDHYAPGSGQLFDIHFSVADNSCRPVSITMNVPAGGGSELARLTITRL